MSQNHQDPAVASDEDLPPVEITLQAQIRPVTAISASDDKAKVSTVSEVFVSPIASSEDVTTQPGQSPGVRFNDETDVHERADDYLRPSIPAKISVPAATKSPNYLSRAEIKEILRKGREDDEKFMTTELGSHASISDISMENSDSPWSPRKSPDQAARSSASNSSHGSQDSDWPPVDKKNPFRGKVPPVPVYQEDLIGFETEIPDQKSEDNSGRLPRAEKKSSRGKAMVHPIDYGDEMTDKASRARRDSCKLPERNSFLGKVLPVTISEEQEEDLKDLKTGNGYIADKAVAGKSMAQEEADSAPGTSQSTGSNIDVKQGEKRSTSQEERRAPTPLPRKLTGKARASVRSQDPPTPRQRGRLPPIVVRDTVIGKKQREFDGEKKGKHLHLPGLVRAKHMGKGFKKNLPKLAALPKRMTASMNKLRGNHAMKMTPKMKVISLDAPQPKPEDSRTGRLSRDAFIRMRKEKVAAANAEWDQMEGLVTPEKPSVQFADRSNLRLYWEKPKTLWQSIKGFSLFKKCSAGETSEVVHVDYVVDTGDVY